MQCNAMQCNTIQYNLFSQIFQINSEANCELSYMENQESHMETKMHQKSLKNKKLKDIIIQLNSGSGNLV